MKKLFLLLTLVLASVGANAALWVGETPAAGQFYIYNPTHEVFLKAVSTVTKNPTEATLFTLSAASDCTISYEYNGTNYVSENNGGQIWGADQATWKIESNNDGYYLKHKSDHDRWISIDSNNGINYPQKGSGTFGAWTSGDNNNRTWIFISKAQYEAKVNVSASQGNGPNGYGNAYAVETYNWGTNYGVGKVISKRFTGLENGFYTVEFYAIASKANENAITDGAGIAQKYVTTGAGTITNDMTVWAQNSITPSDSKWLQSFTVKVTDGTLEYGIQNVAEGGNWYVIQFKSLIKVENGDLTHRIVNNSFETGNTDGWTTSGSVNHKTEAGNGSASGFAEICTWGANVTFSGELSQTLNNMPNGYYQLDVYYQAAEETSNQLFVGSAETELVGVGTGWKKASVIGCVTDNTLLVGAKTQVENKSWQWANFDDFALTYLGDTKVNLQVSGTAKYGTFCASFDVTLPGGVQAFSVTKGSGDWIELTELGTAVSGGTPVVLVQEGDATIAQDYYNNYAKDVDNSGCLKGVYTKTGVTSNDGNYLLQYKNGKVGFNLVTNDGLSIGANRCYLHVENAGARIALGEDDETAIESLQSEARSKKDGKYLVGNRVVIVKAGKAYSLNGQIIK